MTADHRLPVWAPRVSQRKIRRLYATDAAGIYDAELIDDVGYGLLARCESFIAANEARQGTVRCPRCGASVHHTGHDKDELMICPCGWSLTWGDYFATIQHQQLSGAEPVLELFRSFVARFPRARTPRARMLLIDELLHGFHWYFKTGTPTRPVAVNLIEGRLWDVIAVLDELTYGPESTPGLTAKKARWDEQIAHAQSWRRQDPSEGK